MLGKLIKNEFKATSRNYMPVYLILIVVTVLMKVMMEITENVGSAWDDSPFMSAISIIATGMYVLALMAVIFGTVVFIIKRFYDNILKDEGYLTFTLPATTGQHIASKVLVSYTWVIASALMIILSVIILLLGDAAVFEGIKNEISAIIKIVNEYSLWKYVIEVIALLVIMVYVYIMTAYTCLSVGQLVSKHRIGGAILTYIVIYMIQQFIGVIFVIAVLGTGDVAVDAASNFDLFHTTMLYGLGLGIGESVIFTIVTYIMLNKKLNLE